MELYIATLLGLALSNRNTIFYTSKEAGQYNLDTFCTISLAFFRNFSLPTYPFRYLFLTFEFHNIFMKMWRRICCAISPE
jgi:hypothetical protein